MSKKIKKENSQAPSASIESNLGEKRLFKPSKAFSENARIHSMAQYERLYRSSIKDPEKFFAKQAEELHWFKKWRRVMDHPPAPSYSASLHRRGSSFACLLY